MYSERAFVIREGVQKMININVDVSEDVLANSIINVSNGEPDTKSILVIAIIVASIGLSILKHVMTTRERKQHEKIAEKAMLGWIQAGKNEKTYTDMVYRQYGVWACIFISCLFLHAYLIINLKINSLLVHIISRVVYGLCSCLYGAYLCKNKKIKESMKINRKRKIITSALVFLVFFITFNLMTIDKLFVLAEIIFWITIIIWIVAVFNDWELKYVYDNKYATIETKQFGTIDNVQAWNIRKHKGWVGLKVSEKGELIEKRIKKEDILGATYYGGPVAVTTYNKFWIICNRIVE